MSLMSKKRMIGKQRGSTLIEVLIAFFILAIGLLGVVGMQVSGVRSNQMAQFGTHVNMLAMDMAGRIRAYDNPAVTTDDNFYDGIDTNSPGSAPSCIYSVGGCSGATVKQYDVYEWSDAVTNVLPGGRGTVTWVAAREVYEIKIMWDAERTGANGTGCSGNAKVDLACFVMEVSL